jgi:hypothetical protein
MKRCLRRGVALISVVGAPAERNHPCQRPFASDRFIKLCLKMKTVEAEWTSERLLEEIRLNRAKAAKMGPSLERQALMARTSRLSSLAKAKKWLTKAPTRRVKS